MGKMTEEEKQQTSGPQDFLDPWDYSDFKLVLEEGTHPDYMTHTRRGCVNFV